MIKLLAVLFMLSSVLPVFAGEQDPKDIANGKQLYIANKCAACHGDEGKGDGGDAEAYDPYPTNLHDTKAYHHGYKKEDIIHTIKFGNKENPNSVMPPFDHLTDQELKEITAYILSLQEK